MILAIMEIGSSYQITSTKTLYNGMVCFVTSMIIVWLLILFSLGGVVDRPPIQMKVTSTTHPLLTSQAVFYATRNDNLAAFD